MRMENTVSGGPVVVWHQAGDRVGGGATALAYLPVVGSVSVRQVENPSVASSAPSLGWPGQYCIRKRRFHARFFSHLRKINKHSRRENARFTSEGDVSSPLGHRCRQSRENFINNFLSLFFCQLYIVEKDLEKRGKSFGRQSKASVSLCVCVYVCARAHACVEKWERRVFTVRVSFCSFSLSHLFPFLLSFSLFFSVHLRIMV